MPEPSLFALVLRLHAAGPGSLTPHVGHQVQALFLDLLAQVRPDIAQTLHEGQHTRAYTLAPLQLPAVRDERRPFRRGDTLALRATLLHGDLFGPLAQALIQQSVQPTLRLGQLCFQLGEVCGTPGHDPWAGYDAWETLLDRAAPLSSLTLQFATPTQISQGEDVDESGRARPRAQLLPLPDTIFSSIARRFNEFAPEALRLDLAAVKAAAETALVAEYELHTSTLLMGRSTIKGFQGWARYELRGNAEQQRLLNLLAEAAFYLGVGAKTARGLGLCRRIDAARVPARPRSLPFNNGTGAQR